ncbi:MAG: hypothetical protein ACXV6L_08720 [Halobacteriota archaeon]
MECLEEIAGSAELIDFDHKLSTLREKLSTCSELCTDNTRSSVSYPLYANNNPFSSYHSGETLSDLTLPFTADELSCYVENRIVGLADKSRYWINRSAQALWRATLGMVSRQTMKRLRTETLKRYRSPESHGKTLAFAKAFLKYLTKTRLDTRYAVFEVFLEMPKTVKIRKAVTPRIVTQADIENVLTYIRRTDAVGGLSRERSQNYTAFIIFGAYTGQRSIATISCLTVGHFRALGNGKQVLHVTPTRIKSAWRTYTKLLMLPRAEQAVNLR